MSQINLTCASHEQVSFDSLWNAISLPIEPQRVLKGALDHFPAAQVCKMVDNSITILERHYVRQKDSVLDAVAETDFAGWDQTSADYIPPVAGVISPPKVASNGEKSGVIAGVILAPDGVNPGVTRLGKNSGEIVTGSPQPVVTHHLQATKNPLATPEGSGQVFAKMDVTGLEPVTSTMSTWRSNQLIYTSAAKPQSSA